MPLFSVSNPKWLKSDSLAWPVFQDPKIIDLFPTKTNYMSENFEPAVIWHFSFKVIQTVSPL